MNDAHSSSFKTFWIFCLIFIAQLIHAPVANAQALQRLSKEDQRRLEAFGVCENCFTTQLNRSGPFIYPQKIPSHLVMTDPKQAAYWRAYMKTRSDAQKAQATQPPAQPLGPKNLRWGSLVLAYTTESFAKLLKVAKHELTVPRGQDGRRKRAGNVSKGMCMQAVMDILIKTGVLDQRIWTNAAAARTAFEALRYPNGKPRFANVIDVVKGDATKAPVGSILIYDDVTPRKRAAKRFGHIEVKIKDEHSNVVYWSDYYKSEPIDRYAQRKLRAVLLPLKDH